MLPGDGDGDPGGGGDGDTGWGAWPASECEEAQLAQRMENCSMDTPGLSPRRKSAITIVPG